MKLCLPLLASLASLVLAAGCKTDKEGSAGSTAPAAEPPATTTTTTGRSGEIDQPERRGPERSGERPALPAEGDAPPDEDPRVRRKRRMADLDKDGDGQISETERAEGRRARLEDLTKRLDTDGDGKLTVEELKASRVGARIDVAAVDANGDGVISADELQKAMEDARAKAWGNRQRGSGDLLPPPQ